MLPALIFRELCFFLESQGCCGGCQVDSIETQEAGKEQIVVFNGIRPKTNSSHLLFLVVFQVRGVRYQGGKNLSELNLNTCILSLPILQMKERKSFRSKGSEVSSGWGCSLKPEVSIS